MNDMNENEINAGGESGTNTNGTVDKSTAASAQGTYSAGADQNQAGADAGQNPQDGYNANPGQNAQGGYNANPGQNAGAGYSADANENIQSGYSANISGNAQGSWNQDASSGAGQRGGYQFSQPAGNVNYTDKNSGSQQAYTNPDPLAQAANAGAGGGYAGNRNQTGYTNQPQNGQNGYGSQAQNGYANQSRNDYGSRSQSGQSTAAGQTAQNGYANQNQYGAGQPGGNQYGTPVQPVKPKKDHTGLKHFGAFVGKVAAGALVASVVFSCVFGVAQRTGLVKTSEPEAQGTYDFSQQQPDWNQMPDFGGGQDGNGSDNEDGSDEEDGNASQQAANGPKLGIRVETVSDAMQQEGIPAGARIVSVDKGSAAAAAGLEEGDIITSFNGTIVKSSSTLAELVQSSDTGKEYKLNYKRADGSDYKTYSTTVEFSDDTASDETASAEEG